MNNKHQKLIDGKVAEFADQDHGDVLGLITFFEQTLKDTIDKAIEEERERVFLALPEEMIVHEYMPSENTPARRGWNDYRMAVIKTLDKTPPNKV